MYSHSLNILNLSRLSTYLNGQLLLQDKTIACAGGYFNFTGRRAHGIMGRRFPDGGLLRYRK